MINAPMLCDGAAGVPLFVVVSLSGADKVIRPGPLPGRR